MCPPDRTLVDVLRNEFRLTGTKETCAIGVCGVCSVLVDGRLESACLLLVGLVDGRAVVTIEGLGQPDAPSPVQRAFLEAGGYQCGICTPGQVVAATALLAERAGPERRDDPPLDGRQPVPLHRLRLDRRVGPPGRRGNAGMTTTFDEPEIRTDGADKVTGVARYTADRDVPGALVVRYRYAGLTHGIVRRIDTERAEQIDGVRAILTGATPTACGPAGGCRTGRSWPGTGSGSPAIGSPPSPPRPESAADAAVAALEVEYDELPALLDPARALDADAPVLHPDAAAYRFLGGERHPRSHPNIQGEVLVRKGPQTDEELERLFAPPAIVIDEVYRTGPPAPGLPGDPCVRCSLLAAGLAQVITTNKAPFSLRRQLSAALDMPLEMIEVDSAVIGGDFGGKGLSIDEYVLLLLARRTGRPVRIAVGYDEEFRAYGPRHGGHLRMRTAVGADGRILAHDADILFDGGAYAAAKPVPELITPGALDSMAPYDIPALRIRVRVVYTNTVPGGHMRCPGEFQAAFASESHVDELAAATGLDPIEFRRRNVVGQGSTSAVGELIRRPMAGPVLEALAAQAPVGGSAGRGFGVALVARRMEGGQQSVGLRPIDDGRIEILTGLPDQGAGAHTMLIRVAARCLSIPAATFTVRQLTTADATTDLGVGASRVTFIASRAVEDAAERLREVLEALAGTIAGGGPVPLRNGRFEAPGWRARPRARRCPPERRERRHGSHGDVRLDRRRDGRSRLHVCRPGRRSRRGRGDGQDHDRSRDVRRRHRDGHQPDRPSRPDRGRVRAGPRRRADGGAAVRGRGDHQPVAGRLQPARVDRRPGTRDHRPRRSRPAAARSGRRWSASSARARSPRPSATRSRRRRASASGSSR